MLFDLDAKLEVLERKPGGFLVRLKGKTGTAVRLMPNEETEKAVVLLIE